MLLITRIEVRRILSIFMSIECASKKVGYFHPVPQRKNYSVVESLIAAHAKEGRW